MERPRRRVSTIPPSPSAVPRMETSAPRRVNTRASASYRKRLYSCSVDNRVFLGLGCALSSGIDRCLPSRGLFSAPAWRCYLACPRTLLQLRKEAITTRLPSPLPSSRNLYLVASDCEECAALDKDGGELFPDPLDIRTSRTLWSRTRGWNNGVSL